MAFTSSMGWIIALSATRLLCGLVIVKLLSAVLGPADFGRVAQVMGVCTLVYSFAGGGVTNGVIRHARATDATERQKWLDAALVIGCFAALFLGLSLLVVWQLGIGGALLGSHDLALVLLGIAATQVAFGFSNTLLAYVSGTGDTKTFVLTNMVGTLAIACVVSAAALISSRIGAAWAVALAPTATALACMFFLKDTLRSCRGFLARFEWQRVSELFRVSFWLILAIVPLPLAQTLVRADLGKVVGWTDVGLWQAIARLSDAYMQLFGLLAVNLLLPRLTAMSNRHARAHEVRTVGGAMLALFVVGGLFLWLTKSVVIPVAYSAEFLPAATYVAPYLVADLAKVAAWILVYKMIADDHYWVQPLAETAQAIGFLGSYFALRASYGGSAPIYSHLASCLMMVAMLVVIARRVGR